MNTKTQLTLVKRDGSHEPFARGKLRRAIAIGMRACKYDPDLADPLVQAVEVHLKYWDEPRLPTTDYVFRCVHAVLNETGLKDVAEELVQYRRWRRGRRRVVRVVREGDKASSRPWRKSLIVRRLEKDFELQPATCRILASNVEQHVLGLGFAEVTQRLVDELLRTELMAWGLTEEVRPGSSSAKPSVR